MENNPHKYLVELIRIRTKKRELSGKRDTFKEAEKLAVSYGAEIKKRYTDDKGVLVYPCKDKRFDCVRITPSPE